jgi:hypothetical protein
MRGNKAGGGKTQGSSIGLVEFITDRIENVTDQLSGALPTTGTTDNQSSDDNAIQTQAGDQPANDLEAAEGNPNDVMPADGMESPDGREPPEGREPPGQNMAAPEQMAGGEEGMANPNNLLESTTAQNLSMNQLYLLGGSMVLLLIVVFLLLKRKTKRSI